MRKRAQTPNVAEDVAGTGEAFKGDRQFVTALHRGLEILRCFRPMDRGLGNLDLAQRSGLPASTVSRLTYTLSRLGYLVYDSQTGRYRLGVPVLGLGYACLSGMKIHDTAQQYMDEMARETGNGVLVALGARDQLTMTYVACARSEGVMSLQLNVGSRLSLARSAIGRAWLAGAPDDVREQLIEAMQANQKKELWPKMKAGIEDARKQIAAKGFYTNLGEWHPDVHAVSVPLRTGSRDEPLYALNCGGSAHSLPREFLEEVVGPKLVRLASAVSLATGAHD